MLLVHGKGKAPMTLTGNILQQILDEPNPFQISNEENKINTTSNHRTSGKITKLQILSSLKQDNQSTVGNDSSLESIIKELDKYASKKAVSTNEKESIRELIEKKRELFRIKLSTSIKKEEIEKLNSKMAAKRIELQKHEEALEADIVKFDNFLKDSDRKALEAVRSAEKEHKTRLEKKSLVKRLKLQLEGVQTRIVRNKSDLEECKELKCFLTSLTPEQWFDKSRKDKSERQGNRRKTRIMKRQAKWREDQDETLKQQTAATQKKRVRRKHQPAQEQSLFKRPATPEFDDEALTSSDEEMPFYFEEPEQLLDFFDSMEEENLFLIQNIQEAAQSLDELELRLQEARIEKGKVTSDKVEELKEKIKTKKELSHDIYCRLQGSRHVYKFEEVRKRMQSLYSAVSSAHLSLCPSSVCKSSANSNNFLMLGDIERELEIVLERLCYIPRERLRKEAKAFAKQRRENNRKKKNEEKSLKRRK